MKLEWNLDSASASTAICVASSLVGETIRIPILFPLPTGRASSASNAGIRKPSVFPVPVFALQTRSFPWRAGGTARAWTSVQVW